MKLSNVYRMLIFIFLISTLSCDFTKENPEEPPVTSSVTLSVLTGIISDESTGKTLANVTVSVNGLSVRSDSSGNYGFGTELKEGSYQLTANKTGYIGITRTVQILKDKAVLLSLKLFPKLTGAVINAATGGSVGLNIGKILQIPANALGQNTEITITPVFGAGIPFLLPDKFILDAVALEPHGLTFNLNATLQITPVISLTSSLYKAVSLSTNQTSEEISGLTFSNNQLNIPIKHFSFLYVYVDKENMRYRDEPFTDEIVPTDVVLSCDHTLGKYELNIQAATVTGSLDKKIIAAQIGKDLDSQFIRTLEVTRAKEDQIKQLKYQISGTKYIFEIKNGDIWTETATVRLAENVKVITEDKGKCHDQGGTGR